MTTIAGARTALSAAIVAAGGVVADNPGGTAPPCYYIFGGGASDFRRAAAGKAEFTFRVVCHPPSSNEMVASSELAGMIQTLITALKSLAGWQLGEVSADVIRRVGGSDFLSADVTASTLIDF